MTAGGLEPAGQRPGEKCRLVNERFHGHSTGSAAARRYYSSGRTGMPTPDLDTLCVNTIRTLSMDAVQQANSGHPGTPMAMAPVAYALWQRQLRFDPDDPIWPNRDRFVLSNGHASMLLYSLLYLAGVKKDGKPALSLDDLKLF